MNECDKIKVIICERIALSKSIITKTALHGHFRGYLKCIGHDKCFCLTYHIMLHTYCSDKLACFYDKIVFITNLMKKEIFSLSEFNFSLKINR